LKRNIGRHKQEEQQEGFEWSAWQAEKLRNINKFRRECSAIMSEYTDVIDSETRQLMEEQFKEGVNGVTVLQSEKISEAPQVSLNPEPEFFGVDDTKVTKLIDDVVNLEKHAETAALRTMDDVYRQTVNKAQLAMSTGSVTLQQAVDMTVRDFLDKGINCIVYRDGRRVNIADYVRMALRTTSTRAKLQGEAAKIKSLGYDTVQVTKYSMCSDTCLPWQGRPYIDDVFSFWDGEIEERENGELWGKSNYCGKWFPLLSTAIHSGLFHPNCRHSIVLYKDGDPLSKAIDNSEIEKRYKLEQKQRRLENEVRRAKRKAEGFSDPDNVKKANKKLREAQKKLREFIDKVNAEEGKLILKRDYSREKIYSGENVDNSEKSGIIEETSKKPITPITDSSIKRVPKVEISGYTDEQCEAIQKQHQKLLEYSRQNNDNKEVAFVFNSDLTNRREFTGADDRLDFGTSLYGKDLFVMHNHPRNSSYSDTDIVFLLGSDNIKSLSIVKNNGFVEILTKTSKFNKDALITDFKRQYKKIVKTGSDAEIDKAVRKFIVNNKEGLEWKENQ
ncbi:MAG: phage minor capsid protein, partial [Ruminococcus flavefaciens]|nr:phage minor capsid protein [Ruminococcus flavefaciens]